jgi:hypothetical protein
MAKKSNKYWVVAISMPLDDKVWELSVELEKEFGYCGGSGASLGKNPRRDMDWSFKTEAKANTLYSALISKFKKSKDIEVTIDSYSIED